MPDFASGSVGGALEAGTPADSSSTGTVRVRRLPDGEFQPGLGIRWESGSVLEMSSSDEGFPPGALLEIECGPMVYLGEVQYRKGPAHTVLVEHAVDRAMLAAIMQDAWG